MGSRITTATRLRRLMNDTMDFTSVLVGATIAQITAPGASAYDANQAAEAVSCAVDTISSLTYALERAEARSKRKSSGTKDQDTVDVLDLDADSDESNDEDE